MYATVMEPVLLAYAGDKPAHAGCAATVGAAEAYTTAERGQCSNPGMLSVPENASGADQGASALPYNSSNTSSACVHMTGDH